MLKRRVCTFMSLVIGCLFVTTVVAADLKLRTNITENLSIGVDEGAAITYYDIKDTSILGGYTIPLVLYKFTGETILNGYDVSLDGGIVGDTQKTDGVLGIGTNAPKVALQFVLDKTVNKVITKELNIPDRAKIGFLYRVDTDRLFNDGRLSVENYGIEFGWKF